MLLQKNILTLTTKRPYFPMKFHVVQVLGIIFLIFNIIGMVSNIISMSNTKTYYSNCMASNAATINTASQTSTQNPFEVNCDGNVPVDIETLKYWDKVNIK